MMGTKMLKQLRDAIGNLNPQEMREAATRPIVIELFASSNEMYAKMGRWLAPAEVKESRRVELRKIVFRAGTAPVSPVIQIHEEGMNHPPNSFVFHEEDPRITVNEILSAREDLSFALARHFVPFREAVVARCIWNVSKENALFSLATAVPSIVPFVSLPWAIGEFASDTAFLTMNQIRLAFQLAAASDREVGYREQRGEIASIVAGAFGWRSIARELVGKIPAGGGLIPKAAVAFAGTYVVGASLERYFRLGYGYSQKERKSAYQAAYEQGKAIAATFLKSHPQPASQAR